MRKPMNNQRLSRMVAALVLSGLVSTTGAQDFDGDGDVDLADFLEFGRCHEGPDVAVPMDCTVFDVDTDGDVDLADAVAFQVAFTGTTPLVSAETGGTLTTPEGIVLEIPPGALPADAAVTVTLVSADDLPLGGLVGVQFTPDGITLNTPATLRLPLPQHRTTESAPVIWEFFGNDPRGAFFTGETVELADDGWTAVLPVHHFSGRGCADNCHAGTREYLEAQFAGRGCSRDGIKTRVAAKYPGFNLPDECNFVGPDAINALLDTFFDEVASFPAPEDAIVPVGQAFLDIMKQAIDQGRIVLIAFDSQGFRPRNPQNRQWRSRDPDHTAAVVNTGGTYQIRNVVNSASGDKIDVFLGGNNVLFWPLEGPMGLDFFRAMRSGEAVERAGCPDFTLGCSGIFGDIPENRPPKWNAIQVYIERPQSDPCHRIAGCWRLRSPDGSSGDSEAIFEFDVFAGQPRLVRVWSLESDGANETTFESFRFTQPNGAANDPAWLNVGPASGLAGVRHTQSVRVEPDQTAFSLDIEFDLLNDTGVGEHLELHLVDLAFSTDQPAETFRSRIDGSSLVKVTFPQCSDIDDFTFPVTIVGERVPCPNAATDASIVDQATQALSGRVFVEAVAQVDPETGECIGCGVDVCGQGVAGTLPLLMLGLGLMKFHHGRRRQRID